MLEGARQYPNTERIYGSSGNSFVAVVEFGDSVRARAITAARLQPQRGRDTEKARSQARSAISSSLGRAGLLR